MLKKLLRLNFVLRKRAQTLLRLNQLLKRRVVLLEAEIERNYKWPTNLHIILEGLDGVYIQPLLPIQTRGQTRGEKTIVSLDKIAFISSDKQYDEFHFTEPIRIQTGGVQNELSSRIGEPLDQHLLKYGFSRVHFYPISRGIMVNIAMFELEPVGQSNKFKLKLEDGFKTLPNTRILNEKVDILIGEFSINNSKFDEYQKLKRDREIIDSFQKHSFRSKLQEAISSFD